ncbi:MAG TPA: low specificity L-threonine aldolase [Steroidobacteraceae bacterium]|nr:low specificity L-threonine aldolase [Steroidobacteraceae bacterium]
MGRNFSSDHVAPACDAILCAVNQANDGFATSYGGDELTARLQSIASELFERPVAVYPVTSGTAANALALSQIVPAFGAIYCYELAHIVTDEAGAPAFFTGGAQLIGFPAFDGKIRPGQLSRAVAFAEDLGIHHVKPGAVTLTQATEWGTVYSREELSAIGETARKHRLPVHMDGARFANALVHLGCTPAEATWKCGVDVLSLGATKNGALGADAVVFFDPAMAQDFERRRKRAGHLMSKLRFVSAQLVAYLSDDLWLRNARHANAMALRMAEGLEAMPGVRLLHPVEANELFVVVSEEAAAGLERQGFHFYRWPLHTPESGVTLRLVTSFATPRADVDEFLAAAAAIEPSSAIEPSR